MTLLQRRSGAKGHGQSVTFIPSTPLVFQEDFPRSCTQLFLGIKRSLQLSRLEEDVLYQETSIAIRYRLKLFEMVHIY